MRPVRRVIVGGGFTGLVHAFFAIRRGETTIVLEKSQRCGGLISSLSTEHGIVESAANGILNSAALEAIAAELGLPILPRLRSARKRFIFRDGKARQMPLNGGELLRALGGLFFRNAKPHDGESMAAWADRVLGTAARRHLIEAALGGVYAGDTADMSAALILRRFLSKPGSLVGNMLSRKRSGRPKGERGTVSFAGGMQQLIDGLADYVRRHGQIRLGETVPSLEWLRREYPGASFTIAAGAAGSQAFVASDDAAERRPRFRTLSVASATRFGQDRALHEEGFGVLFPPGSPVRCRGILMNHSIFSGRGANGLHSETFIYGGAHDPAIAGMHSEQLKQAVEEDRRKLNPQSAAPLSVQAFLWKDALPVYDESLLQFNRYLDSIVSPELSFEGNFRYGIGLASILERAAA